MPGLRQGYTSVCREDACYLDTGLGVAVLQADGYEEQSDLPMVPSHPSSSGQNSVGVAQQGPQPWPSLSLTLAWAPQTVQTHRRSDQ